MRLGKLEKQILLECLKFRDESKRDEWDPDLYRDELPALLFGWRAVDVNYISRRPWRIAMRRGNRGGPYRYYKEMYPDFSTKQATLTRALQTLYAKELIDCGGSTMAAMLRVYSPRRAAALNIEIKKTLRETRTDEELDCVREDPFTGELFTLRRSRRLDKEDRNIKSIRLTDEGLAIAQKLSKR